jgi:hypothetical protein
VRDKVNGSVSRFGSETEANVCSCHVMLIGKVAEPLRNTISSTTMTASTGEPSAKLKVM